MVANFFKMKKLIALLLCLFLVGLTAPTTSAATYGNKTSHGQKHRPTFKEKKLLNWGGTSKVKKCKARKCRARR